ncbi:MAG: hypothetical protein ACRDLP_12460 [Solirubrobacteraceae bacterium]
MSPSTDTKAQIERAIANVAEEVPALAPLKLVFTVVLRGRGDTQQYRVELPGPKITKEIATDARVTIEMPRAFFNVMADEWAKVADWREAFHYGQAKATGVSQILRLVERVVDMHEERTRTRRARRTS